MAPLNLEKRGKVAASEPYYDLGKHSMPTSTKSQDAQTWFDRGLIWVYSFNHNEAAACFAQATLHDQDFALAHWGVAFSSGPNYNKVWQAFDHVDLQESLRKCYDYSRKAKELSSSATAVEQALIEALQHRFPSRDEIPASFTPSVQAYADAMRNVYKRFGTDDLDIITLSADALMNTAPWGLYEARTGKPNLATPVLEVSEILENGLAKPEAKYHPGILHMYIHLVEMSKTPERATKAADYLRDLVPEGGHMCHMPSHIDVLIGDYRRALHSNLKASIADDKYYAINGGNNFYSFYRMHNYHSLIYAAMLAGQSEAALEAVSRMEATITDEMLLMKSPPMVDWLEFFKSVRVHALIRFGKWEELKALPISNQKDLHCVTIAMTFYGKGVAYAATGDIDNAIRQRDLFREAAERVPPTRLIFPNKVVKLLKIASAMLDGELEYRRGNFDVAFKSLRLAIELDDALIYAEPWAWMMPTRHPYAALLLEQGRVEEAAAVYAEDLGLNENLAGAHQHPNNVWALHGYHECLLRLGRKAEASLIKKQLAVAEAGADIVISSSCFCRLRTANTDEVPSRCCI
ncbi:hypothetical protein CkaCkLH20_05336 [Colletotrichum karsti]|uniref:TPR domain protein n=1 Tax=Colletotrichum karsti TaxID=1095194 RepID=A0A9P6I721_9PEZI|nr:uncharacterized protein CkaCkLH20_05336 [Colletotrichum karsti]KAF9877070.1 hypothetical protein CkaCkLH20_05336 [Colletotrichum karsti]